MQKDAVLNINHGHDIDTGLRKGNIIMPDYNLDCIGYYLPMCKF